MPRVRSRAARGLTDDQHGWLMGHMEALLGPVDLRLQGMSESQAIAFLFGSEQGMKETWRVFRHQLIAECVDAYGPGVRPAAWWRWDAPGAPRTPPYYTDQPALLEQWGLIGVHERQRMQVARRARPDPDLDLEPA